MKKYLLDTHIIVWWLTDSPDLQASTRTVLQNPTNEFYVSHESLREIVIKAKLKKADFQLNGVTIAEIANALRETLGVKLLPSRVVHLAKLEALILMQHESKKLARLLPFQLTQALLIQNSMAQRAKQKEIMELDRQVSEYRVAFSQRLNSLRSSVEAWKSRYLVIAPMSGQVHFRSYLQVNQYVANRQELLVIAPASTAYFGELHVPQVNFGKVKLGQRVIIKFAGYPYEQYGSVSGRIAALSDVPASDHTFLAKVSLPDGLQTNYHKQITYRPGLMAQGEIVTEDTRLVERLLYSLRKATNP